MKKYLLTLPVVCSLIAPLCAIGGRAQRQPEDNKSERPKVSHDVTPAAGPIVTRAADPYITLDFIWWRAQEDGLAHAFNGNSVADEPAFGPAPFAPATADRGSVKYPDFNYRPGFKAGFGLQFRHDGWDLFAQYTWWRNNKGHSKTITRRNTDFDSLVIVDIGCPSALLANQAATAPSAIATYDAQRSSGEWLLHFNAIDLELGRNFWISERLTLRPFVGLKGSWMKQDFDVQYLLIFATSFLNTSLDMDLRQWGIGLRTGVDTVWYMTNNWSVFGEFAISGLCNHFKTSRKDFFSGSAITDQLIVNLRNTINSVTAVIEWGLGFRYETLFHNDDYLYMLQAGWEQQIWFDQNRFIFVPNSVPGNLTFQGLTVKTGFYF